jgi:ABC-type multidrug transport system fused ATPase/permease subunit
VIGILSGDLPLLNGSIRRNLCYRRPDATVAELEHIAALCELDAHVASLPDGMDARVGEAGRNIPNGLRQRIALARALLPWPRLLLIDQPEALLDPPGRRALARILSQRGATAVIVTNDLSFIRMADVVWYLEDGTLVETGAPQVLLSQPSRAAQFLGLPMRQVPELASPAIGLPA